jgi:hypothetical protein
VTLRRLTFRRVAEDAGTLAYRPDVPVSRTQMVSFLACALDLP